MAVAGDDLALPERRPDVLLELLIRGRVADLGRDAREPAQHLLVGEAVQRTGEAVEARSERDVRVRQGRADEMRRVGRDVAALVRRMDDEVQAHELDELGLVVAELDGERLAPVRAGLGRDDAAVLVGVAVDARGDVRQLGQQVHRVLVRRLPVLVLVDALGVGRGEGRLGVERGHGGRELGHRVHVLGEVVEHLDDVVGHGRAGVPLVRDAVGLLLGRDLAGDEQPEERLGQGLLAAGGLGQEVLALGDGVVAEADALLRVQQRRLADQALDVAHAAVDLVDGDAADDGVGVLLLELLDLLVLGRDELGQARLERRRRRGDGREAPRRVGEGATEDGHAREHLRGRAGRAGRGGRATRAAARRGRRALREEAP
eukprot:Unigene2679_Nuclearia_a/m.8289 Unigene2679_Nuclearia_a/g.8289  ORF Unigene2679_Nuclearia_a/g.8289 Unigene2679_Nuclearia_a/m.8289 type:complete len:374 (+) Unigene2679_Nuclearia_a:476-1597(+)